MRTSRTRTQLWLQADASPSSSIPLRIAGSADWAEARPSYNDESVWHYAGDEDVVTSIGILE